MADELLVTTNPATGEKLAELPVAGPAEVDAAGLATDALKRRLGHYGVVTLHRPSNVDDAAALSAIAELPERYRDTVPMEKLAADARASLQRLSSK